MHLWNKYLPQIISLKNRAQHIENNLKLHKVFEEISPTQLINKQMMAQDAKGLYTKAFRMCLMLQESQEPAPNVDIDAICDNLREGIARMEDALKLLDAKAGKWGLSEHPQAINYADDGASNLKNKTKHALKALLKIVDELDKSTLIAINKTLSKFID